MPTKTKKCDCVSISRGELERLKADAERCNPLTKKKVAKSKKKTAPKKKIVAPKTKRTVPVKRKSTKLKAKSKAKAKSKSVAMSRNVNNNAISVDVRATPRAISNVYVINPPQQSVPTTVEARRRRERDIPYNAPYLPRRDGSALRLPTPVRTYNNTYNTTEYIERPQKTPRSPLIVFSRKGKKGQNVIDSAPATEAIAGGSQKALPPPSSDFYYQLPDGSSVPLEDCRLIEDPTEKAACQKRNRKKARLE